MNNKKKVLRLSDDAKRSSTPYGIATCCHPIPGDDVIAFINEDYRSVTLHQRNCGVADKLKANFGERIVQAVWTSQNQTRYPVRLAVNGIDTDGIAGRVLGVLYEKGVKVTKVRFEEKDGIFKGEVEIQAHSAGEVQEVRSAMELIKEVSGVTRTDGNSEKV